MRIHSNEQPYDPQTLEAIERWLSCFQGDTILVQSVKDEKAFLLEGTLVAHRKQDPGTKNIASTVLEDTIMLVKPNWHFSGGRLINGSYDELCEIISQFYFGVPEYEADGKDKFPNRVARVTIREHICQPAPEYAPTEAKNDVLKNAIIFDDVQRVAQWNDLFKNGCIRQQECREAVMKKYAETLKKYDLS